MPGPGSFRVKPNDTASLQYNLGCGTDSLHTYSTQLVGIADLQ